MDFVQRLIGHFIRLQKNLRRHRRLVVTAACAVVFATTYALILPAVTLDEETASDTPGVSIEQPAAEESATTADAAATPAADATPADDALITAPTILTTQGDGYQASADVNADAQLPAATTLRTTEVTQASDANAYQSYSDAALAKVREQDPSVTGLADARLFDVSFRDGDSELEPKADVAVSLGLSQPVDASSADDVRVVHIADDGTASVLPQDKVDPTVDNGKLTKVSFRSDSFSVYAVAVVEKNDVQGAAAQQPVDGQDTSNEQTIAEDQGSEASEQSTDQVDGSDTAVDAGQSDSQGQAADDSSDTADGRQAQGQLSASSDSYDVTVTYGADANLPEGSRLSVTEVEDGSFAYDAARQKVIDAKRAAGEDVDESGLGLAALDITIRDTDGKIVEPASSVGVQINAKNLPADTDASSLEVQHIDGQTGEVSTVAQAGSVSLSDATATASFDVSSFSTFTVTWSNNNRSTSLSISCVDESGNELSNAPGDISLRSGNAFALDSSNAQLNIQGYKFQSASARVTGLFGTNTYDNVTSVTATYTNGFFGGWSYLITYQAQNGNVQTVRNIDQNELSLRFVYTNADDRLTASFDLNGGNGTTPDPIVANADGEITFPSGDGMYRNGYTFEGWSTDQNATEVGPEHHRARIFVAGETANIQRNTRYYAVWGQNNKDAAFFIRLNGIIPTEPAAAGEEGGYQNDSYTRGVEIANALKDASFFASQEGVDSRLNSWPNANQLVSMINDDTRSIGVKVRNDNGRVVVDQISDAQKNSTYYNLEVGDEVYVVWYVIKNAGNGPLITGRDSVSTWHVDGVLLVRKRLNLTYDVNAPAGTFANMPAGSQWNKGDQTVAGIDKLATANPVKEPRRNDGYTFAGWKRYVDANDDHQFTEDEYVDTIATNTSITMDHDTHLVAQWVKGTAALTIKKIDSYNPDTVLSNATFTLSKLDNSSNVVSSQTLTTGADGTVSAKNFEIDTLYELEETRAPSGYSKVGGPWFFKLTQSGQTYSLTFYEDANGQKVTSNPTGVVRSNPGVSTELTISNDPIERGIEFKKVADDWSTPLGGAKFELRDSKGQVVDGVLATESDSSTGVFTVSGAKLNFGDYTLTETSAPDGYVVSTSPIKFTVDASGITITSGSNAKVTSGNGKDGGVVHVSITNTPGQALPSTGGSGTAPFAVAGSALIITAIAGYALRRRYNGGGER